MKKLFSSIICLLCFTCLKAQTFTSGNLTVTVVDSMWHDSTSCSANALVKYDITVNSSYIGQIVYTVDTMTGTLIASFVNTTGVSPWSFMTTGGGGSIGGGSSQGLPDNVSIGGYANFSFYPVKITACLDTVIAQAYDDSLMITNPCQWSSVSGTTYADNNANCIFDAGDVGLYVPELAIHENYSSPWGWNVSYASYSGGVYSFLAQQSWMINYTVSLPSYYSFIFPASSCFSGLPYTFTTLPQTGVDFPLQCSSNVDVQCYALSPTSVRPGVPFYMQPYVSNTGCDYASGQLTLVKDSHTIYDASLSSLPADIVSGDTLIWNYSSLTSLSGGAYWNSFTSSIHLETDGTVGVGDTLCFRVFTNIPATDVNPANNDYTICLPVRYSYDPNVKEVSPAGVGPQGYISPNDDTLTYTLHFQNTGNDEAYDIKVIDTLDSHINAASLRVLGTSHNMVPKWLSAHVVQFTYDNIHLPDSTANEAGSHGSVRFSVALNPGLPMGTQIKNTGYIYFDANPAVITNTVINTLAIPTYIQPANTNAVVKIYPNPATDNITVEHLGGGAIMILGMNGSVVLQQNVIDDKAIIDVSKLPAGIYLLKAVNDYNTTTRKFTKY